MHIRNLKSVVDSKILVCENQRITLRCAWQSIAHENIQERRQGKAVPYGPRGTVCDYVPWYFAPRSPMLYAHFKGNVPSNNQGQNPIIYFKSTVQSVVMARVPFVFTDGHAIMAKTNFFSELSDLGQIDWTLMQARYWRDTDDDPDRGRRRQAEFLVYRLFPFNLVDEIVVFNNEVLLEARKCLPANVNRPIIRVDKNWYF